MNYHRDNNYDNHMQGNHHGLSNAHRNAMRHLIKVYEDYENLHFSNKVTETENPSRNYQDMNMSNYRARFNEYENHSGSRPGSYNRFNERQKSPTRTFRGRNIYSHSRPYKAKNCRQPENSRDDCNERRRPPQSAFQGRNMPNYRQDKSEDYKEVQDSRPESPVTFNESQRPSQKHYQQRDIQVEPFVKTQSRRESRWDRGSKSYSGRSRGRPQPYSGARNLNKHHSRNENYDSTRRPDRGFSTSEKSKFQITTQSDTFHNDKTPPSTKSKLKRNYENISEDTTKIKQSTSSIDNEVTENQSRSKEQESIITKQSKIENKKEIVRQTNNLPVINKQIIANQSKAINKEKIIIDYSRPREHEIVNELEMKIGEQSFSVNEERTIQRNSFVNTEVVATESILTNEEEMLHEIHNEDNAQDDTHLNYESTSLPTLIDQCREVYINIPKLNVANNIKNKKAQASPQDKTQSRKKIMNNSVMQLKLFLLECNRKLKDGFKIFYISNVMNADEITDAIFSFEKANTRNLFQVKYQLQEFRAYKKINFRTLMSVDFSLDKIFKVFKENEDIDRIIICSNLELDFQSLKKRNIRIHENKSRGTHQIEVNEESDVFKKMIDKHSLIPKLAEYLDECMRIGKVAKLKGPMKECHAVLMRENVFTITGIEGRKQIAKFHPRFINSPDETLRPAIAQLRRHLKQHNFGELRIDGKIIVSENFGKESSFQHSKPEILVQKLDIEGIMKKFFAKLEFMECEKNLDYHISRELGEKFELIHSDIHVKVVKEELFSQLRKDSDQSNFLRTLEKKILSCDLMNYIKNKRSTEMRLEFESDTLQTLKTLFTQINKSTIVIKSDYPLLCALKIQQVVESLDQYRGQYFFLDVDVLLSAKDNLLAVFSTPLVEHLLVIQTEGADLKSEQIKDCIKDIRQSISNDPQSINKMVLIQNVNDPSLNFHVDVTEHLEIFSGEVGLTKVFQDTLGKTICECYGSDGITHDITLKELILEPSDLTDLLTSVQCVDRIVQEKVLIGEKLIKPIIFPSTYTVPRRLMRHVLVKSAVLKEESRDRFFLFGDEQESKMNRVRYFKDFNSALSSFEEFTGKNKKLNAHLLKCLSIRGSTQLIWQRSSGSVSSLTKYLVENTDAFNTSEPISDVLACRIMILSGKSGSGKSHYLFELAQRLQSNNQNLEHWVVQLNLNNSLLEQYTNSPLSNTDEAVDLLAKIIGYNELHQRLFRLSVLGKLKLKLSLFVDGLEKLRENNAGRVYKILRLIRRTKVRRIYVTARPKFKKILEQQLGEFAYNLDSLTRDEQKNFLVNTWISLADQTFDQHCWDNYAKEIYNANELLGIIVEPLYLDIFAAVFWFCLKDKAQIPTMQRIYDIYREYLDKFSNNLDPSRKEIFDKSFSILSLKSLLHPEDFRKLNLPEVQSEDFAKLNHSSFAEYGAAKWLASLPLQEQVNAFNIMEDLAERASNVFNETFALSCNKFYLEYIQRIGDNRLVVQLFTNYIWNNANDFEKQKYLEEAIKKKRVKLVSELMTLSMEITLPAEFLKQVALYVLYTLVTDKPKKSHPYWSLSEKFLEQVPQATIGMDPDAQLPLLLAHLFARGRCEVVSKVFQSVGDREKEERILRTRVEGRTPLEIVNSSALMTDEQRLATCKFLIERDDSKEKVFSVMTAAARHGHILCFEFFAGKSSENRSNFLKSALRTNKLDVLRFLLNDTEWARDGNLAKNHPLHTAVTERVSIKALEFLISYGGVNNRNSNGETALCIAIKAGVDIKMIKFLVDKEADVNAKDKRGLHAWCYVLLKEFCKYSPLEQLELMRFFKNKPRDLRLPHPDNYQLTCWIMEIQCKREFLMNPEQYNLNSDNGIPRLHTALIEKDLTWFEFLLQHGADPNSLDFENRMAIHLAVKMEKGRDVLIAVRQLLRHGATFDAFDSDGKTPLDLLRSSENASDDKGRAYKLLRQANDLLFADKKSIEQLKKDLSANDTKSATSTNLYWLLHSRDSHGRALVHRVVAGNILENFEDVVKLLQFTERYGNKEYSKKPWFDACDNFGETIVHVIARLGNYKALWDLALKGASLRVKNKNGVIPLSNNPKCKEFLKIANQTIHAVQRGSLESLHGISSEHRIYMVKACDQIGRTLLHLAASGRSTVTRILLCEWKANPNVLDYEGRTPLHYALSVNDLESAKMLVKAGASIDVRDTKGRQPADLENQGYKSVEMVNALNEILERCWRAKLSSTELDATVETLTKKFGLEPSVAVNVCDSSGDTMMHHAVRNDEPELLKALLKHGAVFNARNASKRRPAELAYGEIKKLLDTVQKLFINPKIAYWEEKKDVIDFEIMTSCRKSGGYTLLHTVLEAKKIEESKWLLDRGADLNVTNNFGETAIKLAQGLQLINV